jgi:hypothetical protein
MGKAITEVLRRKIPQIGGIYLAAAWGLLEFTDWTVTRFQLDAPLVTLVLAGLAAFLPIVVWGAWRFGESAEVAPLRELPARSVAVLPFVTLGEAPDTAYLGYGLADQILNDLCKIGDLQVVARTSSFAYEDKATDVRTIGRRLGARAILEGTALPLAEGLAFESAMFAECCKTEDMKIGVKNFIEKGPRSKAEFVHK